MKLKLRSLFSSSRFLILCSGFLVGISLVTSLSWIVCFSLIPLLFYINKSLRITRKGITVDFYIFGLILCGFANIFLFQMSPENWNIGLSGWITIVARVIAWCLVCGFSALAYALLGFLIGSIKSIHQRIIALPLLFPLMEVLRSYLYAAIAYGPKGSFSPNFNWGSLAVPGSGTSLVYSSRIIGFFGISLLVIFVNIACFQLLQRKVFIAALLLFVIAFVTTVGWKQGESYTYSKNIQVSVVHLSEKDDMKNSNNIKSPPYQTNLLVLPEYSSIEQNPNIASFLKPLAPNGVAISSIVNGRSPTGTNRIVYISQTGNIIDRQDKTFLIPTGELLPYSLQLSFKSIGHNMINEAFKYTQQLERGKEPERVFTTKDGITIGTLACSGVSALNEYSRLSNEGAQILVNTASLAFLQPNSLYHVYARNMARFQAVSNNRPFAQASRSGQSYVLDNQGNFLVTSSGQEQQLLSTRVSIRL